MMLISKRYIPNPDRPRKNTCCARNQTRNLPGLIARRHGKSGAVARARKESGPVVRSHGCTSPVPHLTRRAASAARTKRCQGQNHSENEGTTHELYQNKGSTFRPCGTP